METDRAESAAEAWPMYSTAPSETLQFDADGHGHFRDLCLIYGDFHRAVFFQEIVNWFVHNASAAELAGLRKAIAERARDLGKGGKKGRPRASDNPEWLVGAKLTIWHRIVEGRTWWKVAELQGLKPTKGSIRTIERTLSRRQDKYSAVIWKACVEADVWRRGESGEARLERLGRALESVRFRQLLWVRAGLFGPLKDSLWIEGCKKTVLALVERGGEAAGRELGEDLKYLRRKHKN